MLLFAHLEIPTCPFEESAVREDGGSVVQADFLPVCCMHEQSFASCHSVLHVLVVCRECQALRHGLGLILMQAHGVGLRLRDNCFSEEWMALEYSPSTGASHQAVHHLGLMTGTLRGETEAINAPRAQLLQNSARLSET